MIGVDIGIGLVIFAIAGAAYRMVKGPSDADRAVAADLLFFSILGMIALVGVRVASTATFDILIIATLLGFLGVLSLARALTRGKR